MEKVRSEVSRNRRPKSNPSFTSVTVIGSITMFKLNLINMSCQTLGVFRVTTPQSAFSRKYRETSQKDEKKWCVEEERWKIGKREEKEEGGGEGEGK